MSGPSTPAASEKQTSIMRRWVRWAAILIAILILGAAGLYIYQRHGIEEQLRQAQEALDRSDPGWRLADIEAAREVIPDDENGATVTALAAKTLPRNWAPASLDDSLRSTAHNERLPADVARNLEEEMKKAEPALKVARALTDYPRGRYSITYPRNTLNLLLEEQQKLRGVAVLLQYEARRQMQAGNAKEAARACLAGLHAARTLNDEPVGISQLIRIACTAVALSSTERLLAQMEPDPVNLEILQRAIQYDDTQDPLRIGLRGDRGLVNELFDITETGGVPVVDLFKALSASEVPWQARYFPWMVRQQVLNGHLQFLDILTARVEATRLPLHEQEAADKAYSAACRAVPMGNLARAFLPSDQFMEVCYRYHARLRCLAAALASERYRRAQGPWPQRLEQLVPKYLATLPLDPYNGFPLRLKRLPDGLVIYSVGPDRIDNGGEMDGENSIRPGTDLGTRLWDVPLRAQAPRLVVPTGLGGIPK